MTCQCSVKANKSDLDANIFSKTRVERVKKGLSVNNQWERLLNRTFLCKERGILLLHNVNLISQSCRSKLAITHKRDG